MPKDETILRAGTDPKAMIDAACAFAASDQPADQATLLHYLSSASFLDRVDPPAQADAASPKQMKVAKVIKILRDNPASSVSHPTLVALTAPGGAFRAHANRDWLLVYALVPVRPPPPPVIAFWDDQASPDAVWPNDAIIAVCDNATVESAALLERKLVGPQFEDADKIGWMQNPILRHRNDLPLLLACERMVTQTLPVGLRPELVRVLCDYQKKWYYSCDPPKPPPRAQATRPALEAVRRICQDAKANLTLDADLAVAVERTELEVEALL